MNLLSFSFEKIIIDEINTKIGKHTKADSVLSFFIDGGCSGESRTVIVILI